MKLAIGQERQVSDVQSPVAARAGLAAGTAVLTLDGALPVEFLSAGDRVVTRSGSRALAAVFVCDVVQAPMMRISAAGADQGPAVQFIAPGQPVVLRDWRARAFAGAPVAVVPVARLEDGEFVVQEILPSIQLFTLHFAEEETIFAGGFELACRPAAAAV